MIVRGREDYDGPMFNRAQHFEAGHLRQLDVEKNDVRLFFIDQRDTLSSGSRFANQVEKTGVPNQSAKFFSSAFLIFDNRDAQTHEATADGSGRSSAPALAAADLAFEERIEIAG